MQTHYSWNAKIMPTVIRPQWTNTLCGLRAPHDRIDNVNPTCSDCLIAMVERKALGQRPQKPPDDALF